MFCRNILAIRNDASPDTYIRYTINKHQYDLPASGLFIKINDFGLSQLTKSNRSIQNHYLDLFNIIYDVYNGENMGCQSIRYIIKDYGMPIGKFPSKTKLDAIHKKQDELLEPVHKYFNRFINVPAIKKAHELNKKWMIDSEWGAVKNDDVRRFLLRTSVDDILAYSVVKFKPSILHIIADEYVS